jgi:hypothetical protein
VEQLFHGPRHVLLTCHCILAVLNHRQFEEHAAPRGAPRFARSPMRLRAPHGAISHFVNAGALGRFPAASRVLNGNKASDPMDSNAAKTRAPRRRAAALVCIIALAAAVGIFGAGLIPHDWRAPVRPAAMQSTAALFGRSPSGPASFAHVAAGQSVRSGSGNHSEKDHRVCTAGRKRSGSVA